jgi:methionine synthase II (cobalamin-independent)
VEIIEMSDDRTAQARLFVGGTATGLGSLPHRDAQEAADFALRITPELPCIPTLPKCSPSEGMIAQSVVGISGISVGQYGSLLVDADRIDPDEPVTTDLDHGAYAGLRAFLVAAQGYEGPVKWQFTGPVTLGLTLLRAGVPAAVAFEVAKKTVRSHVAAIHELVQAELPKCLQVVFIDEPDLSLLMDESFPIAPEPAVDLMSGALAIIEGGALMGMHSCSTADPAILTATGPAILSLPVSSRLAQHAGALAEFLDRGGVIAWGVVPTHGPVMASAERSWKRLAALWCELVQGGCDATRLRQQSLVTPACGLANHTETTAEIVYAQVRDIGERLRTQAVATRLTVGA